MAACPPVVLWSIRYKHAITPWASPRNAEPEATLGTHTQHTALAVVSFFHHYSQSALETLGGEPRSLSEPPNTTCGRDRAMPMVPSEPDRRATVEGACAVRCSESCRASVPVHEGDR